MQPTHAFTLLQDAHGRQVFTDADGGRHIGVEAIRAFPISAPRHGISLVNAAGRELLWIENLDDLPAEQRSALEEALTQRDFMPILHRVLRISSPTEPSEWEVETDRGRTRFVLNSGDDVHCLDGSRAMVKDVQGLRYLILDLRKLDSASRRLLERYL
jgi:Domain of unknown function (DUF1854)